MALQIQELQLTEERCRFTKSDMDIINYLRRKGQVESKMLFRYITGRMLYNKEVEEELREMLQQYGYRLYRRREFRTVNTWKDNPSKYAFRDMSIWYYYISQHTRPGCWPCGLYKTNEWMSRCYHWQKCHYGISGKCQLAQITMN